MKRIELIFKANGDKIETALDNIKKNYPELHIIGKEVLLSDENYDVAFRLFVNIDNSIFDSVKRLEHHAEGIYEDTFFENVSVNIKTCD